MDIVFVIYQQIWAIISHPMDLFTSVFVIAFLLEIPYTFFIFLGVLWAYFNQIFSHGQRMPYYPRVSCIITTYSEGKDILITLKSLEEQLYRGHIEVLILIDGANVNKNTLDVAMQYKRTFKPNTKRSLKVIPKWQRGGHASSSNLGFNMSTGDIVIMLDGDTSVDNDMISNMVQKFADPNVVGCSGTLRARNIKKNLLTRMQGIEYMLGIHMSRIGLASINSINNVSGAFGAFRKKLSQKNNTLA